MSRTPSPGQADKLRILAAGYTATAPKRIEWVGLLRNGWVERADQTTPRGGLLPPLRITQAGLLALVTAPEERACSTTISAPRSLSAAGSGGPLPRLRSVGSGRNLPALGTPRLSCSSVSALPTIRPIRRLAVALPSPDQVAHEIDVLWRSLDARRAARERRGGYNAAYRCYECRRFVSGPDVTCAHCGYRHGGVNHRAQAGR